MGHLLKKAGGVGYLLSDERERFKPRTPLIPLTSDEYPQKAKRPRYSVLDNYHPRLLGMDDMRPWQEAWDYLKEKRAHKVMVGTEMQSSPEETLIAASLIT